MADNKYAKALLDYVQMPMAQLGAVFGTTPQKMSKALRQEGSNIYESMKSAVTAPGRALQGQMNPQMMMDENGNIFQDDSKMNQEAMNFALNFMGGGSAPAIGKPTVAGELGINAYHGTPAKIETMYHGTTPEAAKQIEAKGFDVKKSADGSIWFTSDPAIGDVAATGQGGIVKRILPKNLKLGSYDEGDKYFIDELINQGYHGMKYPNAQGEFTHYQIFNPEMLRK